MLNKNRRKIYGADGKDGLTPFIGENGNWWIGDTDTGAIITLTVYDRKRITVNSK